MRKKMEKIGNFAVGLFLGLYMVIVFGGILAWAIGGWLGIIPC